MTFFYVDYASPSQINSEAGKQQVGMTANGHRPVQFHGIIRPEVRLPFRFALRALGEIIWSEDTWYNEGLMQYLLDPIVTVYHDRVFFEAFSQDQSVYGAVICPRVCFESEGEVTHGTTNIDFTGWFWGALGEMRSARETHLSIQAGGVDLKTKGFGGRFEKKVDVPDDWVRGFLEVQAGMALPGTRLEVRPVDLVAALRFLKYHKAKVSPRAMRYEFLPGEDARLVLEPWEEVIPLRNAAHNYTEPRTIRVWGRRRLKLIAGLLPHAKASRIYLKGRSLPSFYVLDFRGGIKLLLGLSGWSGRQWTAGGGGFSLLGRSRQPDADLEAKAEKLLEEKTTMDEKGFAAEMGLELTDATQLLARLNRLGLVMYDLETRQWRHRRLFADPIDEEIIYPPNKQRVEADKLLESGQVKVTSCSVRLTKKTKKLKAPDGTVEREVVFRDWTVSGEIGPGWQPVEIVVNDRGRIIFGRSTTDHFKEHMLNLGPDAHMLALFDASEELRREEIVKKSDNESEETAGEE
jgi:hypothetical protein